MNLDVFPCGFDGTCVSTCEWIHKKRHKHCLGGAISDRCETVLPKSCLTPTKTHTVVQSLLQLRFHVLKQLSLLPQLCRSSSTPPPLQAPNKRCMVKPKWRPILPQKTNLNDKRHLLDWWVPFARETLFCYRDNILNKQTTSNFREPPEEAHSKFLWNTANQIICYPNIYSPIRKPEAKTSWMVHPAKSELQVPHYVLNQHII